MLLSPVFADIHCLAQHHEGRIGEVIVVGAPGGVNYRDTDADLREGGYKWRVSGGGGGGDFCKKTIPITS